MAGTCAGKPRFIAGEPHGAHLMPHQVTTGCCVVGGGPAGMMLGFLLARAGLKVAVLEKHGDFLRDFRGDTIHPSTLEIMHELGLLPEFLRLPHQEAAILKARFGDLEFNFADFSHLPTQCKFIALMPQWNFLNFLAEHGRAYPGFQLFMRAEVTELIEERDAIVGVRANTVEGMLEVRAPLVVGCDGRHSVVRKKAGLEVESIGAPMDVLWFRMTRRHDDPAETMGVFDAGRILVMIDRGDYWQCGIVIPKGSFADIQRRGLTQFCTELVRIAPMFSDRLGELTSWDQIRLLTVAVDRLKRWYRRGLLCIGDAAHAMSPVGGVGINLAIQDAVAAANILAEPLRSGTVNEGVLQKVEQRREFPTRIIQAGQVFVQKRVIADVLGSERELRPPTAVRLLRAFPILRRIPARLLGMGPRPEHVGTPERRAA
jgi:2-polyprenyl-6-methoxyphenol hydroxylase-like FAD-dependent oxidoreductase